jgi:hypothetical protein
MMDDLEEDVLQTSFGKSLLEKGNKTLALCFAERFFKGGFPKVDTLMM